MPVIINEIFFCLSYWLFFVTLSRFWGPLQFFLVGWKNNSLTLMCTSRYGRWTSSVGSPGHWIFSTLWARGRCRISPPRFLAECCKRQLNQVSLVLLYFRLSAFSDLCWVCLSVFSCIVLFVSISQVIGCEDRLRNDLCCVGWGVKLYSNQNFDQGKCSKATHSSGGEWATITSGCVTASVMLDMLIFVYQYCTVCSAMWWKEVLFYWLVYYSWCIV